MVVRPELEVEVRGITCKLVTSFLVITRSRSPLLGHSVSVSKQEPNRHADPSMPCG